MTRFRKDMNESAAITTNDANCTTDCVPMCEIRGSCSELMNGEALETGRQESRSGGVMLQQLTLLLMTPWFHWPGPDAGNSPRPIRAGATGNSHATPIFNRQTPAPKKYQRLRRLKGRTCLGPETVPDGLRWYARSFGRLSNLHGRRNDTLLSVALEVGLDLENAAVYPSFTWDRPLR